MKFLFGLLLSILLLATPDSIAQQIPIEGTINFADQTGIMKFTIPPDQLFSLELARIREGKYDAQLTVAHWKRNLFDLSTVLNGSLKVLQEEGNPGYEIEGRFFSKYTLFKNRPFDDVFVDFLLKNSQLVIRSLTFGPLTLSGTVGLNSRTESDVVIKIAALPLEYVTLFLNKLEMISVQGEVAGEIRLRGFRNSLQISGKLISYDGAVGQYEYHMAQLKFDGIYPMLHIDDSQIDQKDKFSFKVKGAIDLSDLENFSTQLRNFVSRPLITGEKTDLEWTLKRLQTEEKGSIEFKYMKRGGSGADEDGLLGIQRRIEF